MMFAGGGHNMLSKGVERLKKFLILSGLKKLVLFEPKAHRELNPVSMA